MSSALLKDAFNIKLLQVSLGDVRVSKMHRFLNIDFFFRSRPMSHTAQPIRVQRSQSIRVFVFFLSQGRVGDQNAGRDETLG